MASKAGVGDPMDVDSLIKGKHSGKHKGKGKGDGMQVMSKGKCAIRSLMAHLIGVASMDRKRVTDCRSNVSSLCDTKDKGKRQKG